MEERVDSPDDSLSPRHSRLFPNDGFLKNASIMAGFSHEDSIVVWLYLRYLAVQTSGCSWMIHTVCIAIFCTYTSGEQGVRSSPDAIARVLDACVTRLYGDTVALGQA